MSEEVKMFIDDAKDKMEKAIKHLEQTLATIRAGRADINILNGVFVDYYSVRTPLNQVSNISTPDAKTIAIQPWEKNMLPVIEKALLAANIGITPVNNGEIIRLIIPALTEERRKELSKQVKHEGENTKVTIRNIRRDLMEELKRMKKEGLAEDLEKNAEAKAQEITDLYTKKCDELLSKKEKDIMTV